MTPDQAFQTVMSSTAINEEFIHEAIREKLSRHATLEAENARRHAQVTAGIQRAADKRLPTLQARRVNRRFWSKELRDWMRTRYQEFGLTSLPDIRVIRKIVRHWPNGMSV